MCNIAGYIGPYEAAPILCEMMAKEAGFAGGYYTGIATVSSGKLEYTKLLGDVDLLVSKAHGDRLPGNIGICHSRSNSGGDWHWSHPFVSNDGKLAYIANGAGGKLAKLVDRDGRALAMEAKGYSFETACVSSIGTYPHLSDGRCVHGSEVMCHLIRDRMTADKLSCGEAMYRAFIDNPSEIVGLSLTSDEPDRISFGRYNQPCMIGRTEDEVFIASTAICFPKDRNYISITALPECSWGYISLNGTVIHRFRPGIPVAPADIGTYEKIYNAAAGAMIKAGRPLSHHDIGKLTASAFDSCRDLVNQRNQMVYEVMRQYINEGIAEVVSRDEEGAEEGRAENIRAKRFYFRLK